jgi:hypothetical protein
LFLEGEKAIRVRNLEKRIMVRKLVFSTFGQPLFKTERFREAQTELARMQNTQPDFVNLSFEFHETRAEIAPGCLTSPDASFAALRATQPLNHAELSQNEKDEGHIQQQMQELLSIWNSRHTRVVTRPESRVSSSASTIIQPDDTASFLPAPRRFHRSVWKAWTRQLAKNGYEK